MWLSDLLSGVSDWWGKYGSAISPFVGLGAKYLMGRGEAGRAPSGIPPGFPSAYRTSRGTQYGKKLLERYLEGTAGVSEPMREQAALMNALALGLAPEDAEALLTATEEPYERMLPETLDVVARKIEQAAPRHFVGGTDIGGLSGKYRSILERELGEAALGVKTKEAAALEAVRRELAERMLQRQALQQKGLAGAGALLGGAAETDIGRWKGIAPMLTSIIGSTGRGIMPGYPGMPAGYAGKEGPSWWEDLLKGASGIDWSGLLGNWLGGGWEQPNRTDILGWGLGEDISGPE